MQGAWTLEHCMQRPPRACSAAFLIIKSFSIPISMAGFRRKTGFTHSKTWIFWKDGCWYALIGAVLR